MWVVRAAIEPLNWAFTCEKSKTGNCLPSGFTHDEKDAKKYKTYEEAITAEMKLRKEKGLTHNQTETSGEKEPTTMTNEERDRKLIAFAHQALSRLRKDEQWGADTCEALQASAFELGIAEVKNNFFHIKKEFQS